MRLRQRQKEERGQLRNRINKEVMVEMRIESLEVSIVIWNMI